VAERAADPAQGLEGYLAFACRTALSVAPVILPHFRRAVDVEDKGGPLGYDPVTVADRAAEAMIRDAIATVYPTHGMLGEEHGHEPGTSPYTWVIDPIDGTKSFILGYLHWGVLLALNDGTRPIVGVACQPFVGEIFYAANGGPAYWQRGDEKRPLRTRRCDGIAQAVVATTDPRQFQSPAERAALAAVSGKARFTRYGGDLYCYTQLAMGLVDVVIETGLAPYDIQALVPLIEGAGGIVTGWRGETCYGGGSVLACGDPRLHAELLKRIAKA
jgi:myo-inositol-1(or 4)-monophosphatase